MNLLVPHRRVSHSGTCRYQVLPSHRLHQLHKHKQTHLLTFSNNTIIGQTEQRSLDYGACAGLRPWDYPLVSRLRQKWPVIRSRPTWRYLRFTWTVLCLCFTTAIFHALLFSDVSGQLHILVCKWDKLKSIEIIMCIILLSIFF